jgi:hypothetical protein
MKNSRAKPSVINRKIVPTKGTRNTTKPRKAPKKDAGITQIRFNLFHGTIMKAATLGSISRIWNTIRM